MEFFALAVRESSMQETPMKMGGLASTANRCYKRIRFVMALVTAGSNGTCSYSAMDTRVTMERLAVITYRQSLWTGSNYGKQSGTSLHAVYLPLLFYLCLL